MKFSGEELRVAVHARNAGLLAVGKQPQGTLEVSRGVAKFFMAVVREVRHLDSINQVGAREEDKQLADHTLDLQVKQITDLTKINEDLGRECRLKEGRLNVLNGQVKKLELEVAGLKKKISRGKPSRSKK